VRSDAAAVATVAGGYGDVAVSALPVARAVGLTTTPLGRAALDLVIHRAVAERDPALRALLETMRSRSLAAALVDAGYDSWGVAAQRADGGTAFKSRVVHELRRMKVNSGPEATP
jgi:molybdate-binding protein